MIGLLDTKNAVDTRLKLADLKEESIKQGILGMKSTKQIQNVARLLFKARPQVVYAKIFYKTSQYGSPILFILYNVESESIIVLFIRL